MEYAQESIQLPLITLKHFQNGALVEQSLMGTLITASLQCISRVLLAKPASNDG